MKDLSVNNNKNKTLLNKERSLIMRESDTCILDLCVSRRDKELYEKMLRYGMTETTGH